MQQVLKPSSFGVSGHYRFLAIQENKLKELQYAGSESCIKCHEDIHIEKSDGYHAQLKCEVCHGPALRHVMYADKFENEELPDSLKLNKPDERKDCAVCHRINAARIKITFDTIDNSMIKQVDPMKHNLVHKKTKVELKCIECHYPHQP
jgi:hypothetical protein